jgi:hypothetical protein
MVVTSRTTYGVHDKIVVTGISLTSEGQWGDCGGAELGTCSSFAIGLSDDGNQIVMSSGAPLAPDALPPTPDFGRPSVFLRNVTVGTTEQLTPNLPAVDQYASPQGEDASPERNEVLFNTSINYQGGIDTNGVALDLYVKNWTTGVIELVSTSPSGAQGDGSSLQARFSPDGRYVVFLSSAGNLTSDNPLHFENMFLRDRASGTTRRLSFPWQGGEFVTQPLFRSKPQMTADNRHVVFSASGARFTEDDDPAMGGIYDLDLVSHIVHLIPRATDGGVLNAPAGQPTISADGRYLAFLSSATNLMMNPGPLPAIFVQDRLTGETINVSAPLGPVHSSIGAAQSSIALSPDGTKVAFDWANYDANDPTFAINEQVYTVALCMAAPQMAAPVPSLSWLALGVFSAMLMVAALVECYRNGVPLTRSTQ